ncbi:MAG: electron transport complex subunit RsxC [Bacillota bacterium]
MGKNLRKFPIGGVHLPEEKFLTNEVPIEDMNPPEKVIIPVKQHIGAPSRTLVKKGQYVKKGECIAENDQGLSARIHASISGEVVDIKEQEMVGGFTVESIVIARKGKEIEEVDYEPITDESKITPELVRERVEKAGVAGMGGACFPTHVKLNPPSDKPIDTVIINGAECEPYITVDDRLMQEKAEELYQGLELIRITVGAEKGIVACEVNKPKALEILQEEAEKWQKLEAVPLDTRYPHGAEKHLIKAVLNREVPLRKLPMDVEVVVNNVQTAIAIKKAVYDGKPLISRVTTVSGRGVKSPKNLNIPFGTTVQDVMDYCGGVDTDRFIVIIGGPMTGFQIDNYTIPVDKGTTGIIILNENEYEDSETRVCIRCGKCVNVCPMYLTPNRIVDYVNNDMYSEADIIGINDCIECGACAFACPSKRPLLRWIREGKAALNEME